MTPIEELRRSIKTHTQAIRLCLIGREKVGALYVAEIKELCDKLENVLPKEQTNK